MTPWRQKPMPVPSARPVRGAAFNGARRRNWILPLVMLVAVAIFSVIGAATVLIIGWRWVMA